MTVLLELRDTDRAGLRSPEDPPETRPACIRGLEILEGRVIDVAEGLRGGVAPTLVTVRRPLETLALRPLLTGEGRACRTEADGRRVIVCDDDPTRGRLTVF